MLALPSAVTDRSTLPGNSTSSDVAITSMSPPAAERLEADSSTTRKTPVRARNIARRRVIEERTEWKKGLGKSTGSQGVLFSQLQAGCLNYTLNPC